MKLLGSLIFILVCVPTWAQSESPPLDPAAAKARAQSACGADFEKFCPAADGPLEHIECLIKNEPQLSLTCATFLAEVKKHGPPPGADNSPHPKPKKPTRGD